MTGYTLSVGVAFFSDFTRPFIYHTETLFVLIVGTVMFLIPAYAFKYAYDLGDNLNPVDKAVSHTVIDIKTPVLLLHAVLVFTVSFFSIWVYWKFLQQINAHISFIAAIGGFRNLVIRHPEVSVIKGLFLLAQCKKIFLVTGYFLLFVYARNAVIRKSFFKDKWLLINLALTIFLIGTDGGRGQVVAYVLAGLALWFYYDRLYNKHRFKFTFGFVIKVMIVFLLACTAFYAMLYPTGRYTGAFSFAKCWHHVSFYLGGCIPLLDNFLTYPTGPDFFGKENFYNLINQLSKLGVVDVPLYPMHLEFRPGVYPGNTYTAYRSYIYDFGYFGLVCLPFFFSVCVNWIYYATLKASKKCIFLVGVIIYSRLVYQIFGDFVRNKFYGWLFDFNIIPWVIGIALIPIFLNKLGWMEQHALAYDFGIKH